MSSTTPLGMPGGPRPPTVPTWKTAWDEALYGARGFFRREAPAAHFRTSVHASPLFARAIVDLARAAGLDTIVDVGAGRGELLVAAHGVDPELHLLGVEVVTRPDALPSAIDWSATLPEEIEGLVIANEWLDNVPCHVVEVGGDGVPRIVHVEPETGEETLGASLQDGSVPETLAGWSATWWPLDPAEPGTRAEIGTSRESAWRDVVARLRRGIAVAVDYGHTRADRPSFGTLRSYLHGVEVPLRVDGSRDVTAHVALDSVAAAAGGRVLRQATVLRTLGIDTTRPTLDRANRDPAGYLGALEEATEAAELTARAGLGDFGWIVTTTGGCRWPL